MARVQYLSQVGTNVAAVALYRNDLAHGADEVPPAPKLNQALMDAGYNYDHLNVDSLLHCTMHEGGRDQTLVTQGGAAVSGAGAARARHDQRSAGGEDHELGERRVADSVCRADAHARRRARGECGKFEAGACGDGGDARFAEVVVAADRAELVTKLQGVAEPNIRFHGDAVPFIQKRIGKMNVYFLRNETDAPRQVHAEFEAEGAPELWDPWTGKIAAIAGTPAQRRLD